MAAPKGNKNAAGNPGKATSYKPSYVATARELARYGATNFSIAQAFGVSEQTIYNWRYRNPDFDAACEPSEEDKLKAVKRALHHRATGYSHRSVKIVVVDKDVKRVRYTEHYPPDVAAMKFYLTNKSAGEYSEKTEVEQSGGLTVRVTGGLPETDEEGK